jgi:exonuclease SbcC
MQLRSVTLRGFGPFRESTTLDLDALGDGARLVAVHGGNGTGKSTLLELAMPGAMYRSCPTRGALRELALDRDAVLEATITNGRTYRVKHLVDAVSGKSEATAHVLDESGEWRPEFESSKVSTFSAWAESHLPAPEVLFASVFGAQAAGGFLSAKPTERKAILLRCLGIERWEQWAQCASAQARTYRGALDMLLARIADEQQRAQAQGIPLALTTQDAAQCDEQVEQARKALAAAEVQLRAYNDSERARVALAKRIAEERGKLADLDSRITNNRKLLADSDAVREASTRLAQIDEELTASRETAAKLDADRRQAASDLDRWQSERRNAQERATRAVQRLERLTERLGLAEQVKVAQDLLPELESAAQAAQQRLSESEAKLDERRAYHAAADTLRIVGLRTGLETIAGTVPHPSDAQCQEHDIARLRSVAVSALETDDARAEERDGAGEELTDAVKVARDYLDQANTALRECRAVADRTAEVEQLRREHADATAECDDATRVAATADTNVSAAAALHVALLKDLTPLREGQARAEAEAAPLRSKAKLLTTLETAEARLAEIEPVAAALRTTIDQLEADLAGLPELAAPCPAPSTEDERITLRTHELAARVAHEQLAVARQQDEQRRASEARLREMLTERAEVEADLGDWNRLAADLGKKGIQAATIDAALPELVTVANQLLHEAFGSRFTIDLRTQTLNSTGKKTLETLDVVVIDTEQGRDALAETYSGGERVIIGEALSLALTTLACRESGVESPTLIRDESGAALDSERAPQWVAMLRRAGELIGASKVLFIAHNPELWQLADARIEVTDGMVVVS